MSIPADATIFLVEDDPDDVFLMERALKAAKISNKVHRAENGRQAIDYLAGNGIFADRTQYPLPRLVLLDLKLPYKDGFEVLEWLRRQPMFESMVVVILTSSSQQKDLNRAYKLGARSYLVKPPTPEMIKALDASLTAFWSKPTRTSASPFEPQK